MKIVFVCTCVSVRILIFSHSFDDILSSQFLCVSHHPDSMITDCTMAAHTQLLVVVRGGTFGSKCVTMCVHDRS